MVFAAEVQVHRNTAVSMNRIAAFIPDGNDLALPRLRLNQQPFQSHGELLELTPLSILPPPLPSGMSTVTPVCSALLSRRSRGHKRS